jgi:pterin-4a-carbinolamine dehydratase
MYLVPLYPRGWGVSFKKPKAKELQPGSNDVARSDPSAELLTAHLVGRFNFKNYKSAAGFLSAVAEIAESENVKCQILPRHSSC